MSNQKGHLESRDFESSETGQEAGGIPARGSIYITTRV